MATGSGAQHRVTRKQGVYYELPGREALVSTPGQAGLALDDRHLEAEGRHRGLLLEGFEIK